MLTLNVHGALSLLAEEEELDSIIQAADGNDYVVIMFSDNSESPVEFSICHMTIAQPTFIKKKVIVGVETKKGRGRPRKPVDMDAIPRKPRQPTAYNLFLKEKLRELSLTNPSLKNKDRMKIASDMWKAQPSDK
jgi:hypothetical protein